MNVGLPLCLAEVDWTDPQHTVLHDFHAEVRTDRRSPRCWVGGKVPRGCGADPGDEHQTRNERPPHDIHFLSSPCRRLRFFRLLEPRLFYHAPWMDSIRRTTLGGPTLTPGFMSVDRVCYAAGSGSGVAIEIPNGIIPGDTALNTARIVDRRNCWYLVEKRVFAGMVQTQGAVSAASNLSASLDSLSTLLGARAARNLRFRGSSTSFSLTAIPLYPPRLERYGSGLATL